MGADIDQGRANKAFDRLTGAKLGIPFYTISIVAAKEPVPGADLSETYPDIRIVDHRYTRFLCSIGTAGAEEVTDADVCLQASDNEYTIVAGKEKTWNGPQLQEEA